MSIDLRPSDTHVDLLPRGLTLAFRIGFGGNSTLKRRKLGEVGSVLVASPDYLALLGFYAYEATRSAPSCLYRRYQPGRSGAVDLHAEPGAGGGAGAQPVQGEQRQVARDLALAGQGVAYCPAFVLDDDLEAGRLIRLLPGMGGRRTLCMPSIWRGAACPASCGP